MSAGAAIDRAFVVFTSVHLFMDDDLDTLTHDELIAEVKRLRAGIREHRDSTGHELCWHHPELWGLLPERTDPQPSVPAWPQFMRGCIRYRQSLDAQLPEAPRTTAEYDDPER
jgi:hypothetical protein